MRTAVLLKSLVEQGRAGRSSKAYMEVCEAGNGENEAGAGAGVAKPQQADRQEEHGVPHGTCPDLRTISCIRVLWMVQMGFSKHTQAAQTGSHAACMGQIQCHESLMPLESSQTLAYAAKLSRQEKL